MSCFENVENESLDACLNLEIQAGVSEIGIKYAFHKDITTFPMPKNIGEVGYNFESAVEVNDPILFAAGKGFGEILIQANTGELMADLVGNIGNKKHKSAFSFQVAGNNKKTLGFLRTCKNIPMVFAVPERDGQVRLVGDKNNAAYISEGKATTGKGGEDDKNFTFTVEAFSLPIVYSGALTLTPAP